ncbi:LytR/AlgR family response regulator transcription factor [Desulfobaculum bizertense]|uniref:Two component transcriptional regulator, LytTR family n=1 Tax=Desulfobaculum bizertense DSM 18034 TaxID=1121442 RepID=A0A1T4VYK3_9BACT|nr:LytTR family DNA-binding domain-containing protein [Desulfobaculum bizertense]UIJ36973.1 LytTR family DNA-binding domain-containing protein [Desulfobaculum bizertense]SKA69895.1 two component transcriptional regulator, LytTR family [Desulfobaculum bizertense DSM 18034]
MLPRSITAIIVDDEPPARDELAYMLSAIDGVELVAEASSAGAAVEAILKHEPDVVFLDIEMPGRNGFHVVAETLALEHPPLFVFATAFDQYAIRAFEANAVDYLLKPVSEQRLESSIDKVRQQLEARHPSAEAAMRQKLEKVLESVGGAQKIVRIPVEKGGRVVLLPPEDVYFLSVDGKKITVYTHDSSASSHGPLTLDRIEARLKEFSFYRVNRSTLVNLAHVHEFSPWFNGKYNIVMDDAGRSEIPVSRSRVAGFKENLGL